MKHGIVRWVSLLSVALYSADLFSAASVKFSSLPEPARKRATILAMCASSAYPDGCVPVGFRAMSDEEWRYFSFGRDAGDIVFEEDGFLNSPSGFRVRLLIDTTATEMVVCFSGCDGVRAKNDVCTAVKSYVSAPPLQFREAARVMRFIDDGRDIQFVQSCGNMLKITVVGHSMGGALAAFSVASQKLSSRVRLTTFNAMPVPNGMFRDFPGCNATSLEGSVRNVHCSSDFAYKLPGVHPGKEYVVDDRAIIPTPRVHSIDYLVEQMELTLARRIPRTFDELVIP